MTAIRRIGVLTGGGDCPGLNAALRAVVRTALSRHGIEVVGILDGYAGLVEGSGRPLSEAAVAGTLSRGGTIIGTSNRSDPFRYVPEGAGADVSPADRSAEALRQIGRFGIDALVPIGGDGTLAIAQKLAGLGVALVGVPKTIDNDIAATDASIGFDSALTIATEAIDRLQTTADAHHRVMVLEVMGRYAGWIALRAGIAGGSEVILIPEIGYGADHVTRAIRQRIQRGKRSSIVVVAEGAATAGGQMVVSRTVAGSPDPIRLGGVGQRVATEIEQALGVETRVTVLGHLQRGGTPTPFDRWLATRLGVAAVELLAAGQAGRMVCLKGTRIESVPLAEAIGSLRRVDPAGDEVSAARAVGTSFGD